MISRIFSFNNSLKLTNKLKPLQQSKSNPIHKKKNLFYFRYAGYIHGTDNLLMKSSNCDTSAFFLARKGFPVPASSIGIEMSPLPYPILPHA